MSYKVKTIRLVAWSALSAPALLYAAEPSIIVPSKMAPRVVFEKDNTTRDVLDRFRNGRSSEQIHFQPIESLFPHVPNRESVREGYSLVKEIVDAKKAAIEAAEQMEQERDRLAEVRAELERDHEEEEIQADAKSPTWDRVPEEFDYYGFSDLEPQPEPNAKANAKAKSSQKSAAHSHSHGHNHNKSSHAKHANQKQPRIMRPLSILRSTVRRVGRSNR